jgi:hypothetical protein
VCDGGGEVDVAEAFAADFGLDDFDAAFLADDAAVFHALVFTADALVVLDGSEDAGAEEAVFFGFEGAVVDGFGFFDFAVAPLADLFGGGEADADGREVQGVFGFLEEAKDIFHRKMTSRRRGRMGVRLVEGLRENKVCEVARIATDPSPGMVRVRR